jgi:hypothetical protein
MAKQVEKTDGDNAHGSMATIMVNVPVVLTGTANTVNWSLNLAGVPDGARDDLISGLLAQGALIIAQRAGSGKDVSERAKLTKQAIEKMQDGLYAFGQGGGGARLTPEQDAWIEWLNADGHKADGKPVNGKTLRQVQLGLCAAALIKKGTATKDTAVKMAEDELANWTAFMEAKRPALAAIIGAKRLLATGIKVVDEEEF